MIYEYSYNGYILLNILNVIYIYLNKIDLFNKDLYYLLRFWRNEWIIYKYFKKYYVMWKMLMSIFVESK